MRLSLRKKKGKTKPKKRENSFHEFANDFHFQKLLYPHFAISLLSILNTPYLITTFLVLPSLFLYPLYSLILISNELIKMNGESIIRFKVRK